MKDKTGPQSWQEMLQKLIEDPVEKKRIVSQANIQPITLWRWIKGISTPHVEKMRSLLNAIPYSSSQAFAQLVIVDFPTLLSEHTDTGSQRIPSEFYQRVLKAYATTSPPQYPQLLQSLILQHMVEYFASGSPGLAIRVARCFWHRTENRVRSLQVVQGIGTPPWSRNLDQRAMLFGAESLAGMAIMKCRVTGTSRWAQNSLLSPLNWGEYEQSALACPLMHQTRIAGCLLMASTQPDAFRESHYKLIECYAHLMALTFKPDAFFDLKDIDLHVMPPYSRQKPLFDQFHQRVYQKAQRQSLALSEAQEQVWQEIEEEMIEMV